MLSFNNLWWPTRDNAVMYAEAGYVVIMPNLTGSLGYGSAFQLALVGEDARQMRLPYEDLEGCLDHVENSMPFADMERVAGMGFSYGGTMMSECLGS